MNTLEAISLRKSTRAYKPEQISEQVLDIIVKAGIAAPVASAKYETLHITIVQNQAIIAKITDAISDMMFKMMNKRMTMDFGAPTIIFVSSQPAMVPGVEYANAACMLENMILAATDQKVDSILWGAGAAAVNQNEELQKLMEIPEGYKTTLCASFGYAVASEQAKEHTITINRV